MQKLVKIFSVISLSLLSTYSIFGGAANLSQQLAHLAEDALSRARGHNSLDPYRAALVSIYGQLSTEDREDLHATIEGAFGAAEATAIAQAAVPQGLEPFVTALVTTVQNNAVPITTELAKPRVKIGAQEEEVTPAQRTRVKRALMDAANRLP